MAFIKKQITNAGCVEKENPSTLLEEMHTTPVAVNVAIPHRTKTDVHATAASLLSIFTEDVNSANRSWRCFTSVFAAVLFTIGKSWNQPQCPRTEKLVQQMWCAWKKFKFAFI